MTTYSKLKRICRIESLNEQLKQFEGIEKSLSDLNLELNEMAVEFTEKNEVFKSVQASNDYAQSIKDIAKSKHDLFLKDYHPKFIEKSKKRSSLLSKKDTLLEDRQIAKAADIINSLSTAKLLYKSGKITLPVYDEIIKSKTEGPVKYSDIILFNEDGKILLTQRSSMDDSKPGEWCIPGGHVDPGEDYETAAIRELKEETNLDVEGVSLVGEFKDSNANICYYRGYVNSQKQQIVLEDSETHHYEWIDPYKELDNFKLIFDQKENIKKVLKIGEIYDPVVKIQKAAMSGEITPKEASEQFEKAMDEKQKKAAKVMEEFKDGKLKTSSGKIVTSREQAIAIAMSEAGISKSDIKEEKVEKAREYKTLEVEYSGGESDLADIVNYIAKNGNTGHSFDIVIDPDGSKEEKKTFGWDGDGSNYIKSVKVDGVDLRKSESPAEIQKSDYDEISHLKEMIEEHKRLVKLLERYEDQGDDIKEELKTQKEELSKYETELRDEDDEVNEKSQKVDDLFKSGLISETLKDELIEKARSGKYSDTAQNRKLKRVGQPYGTSHKEETVDTSGKKKEDPKKESKTSEQLNEEAKNSTVGQLEAAIKESSSQDVRQAAHNELQRREKEEKPKSEEDKKFGEGYEKDQKDKNSEKKEDSSKKETGQPEKKQSKKSKDESKKGLDQKLNNDDYEYHVRYSDHIEEDLKRGWSSWNFGQDGFEGDKDSLVSEIQSISDSDEGGEFWVSGMNFWIEPGTKIDSDKDAVYFDDVEIREHGDGYWTAVDNVNAKEGLSSHELPDDQDNVKGLVKTISSNRGKYDGSGDGDSFNPDNAKVIYSKNNMHIIQVG